VRRIATAGAAVVLAATGAVVASGVPGPDPAKQSQLDGCSRSRQAEFTRQAPAWVYVNDKDFPASGPAPPARWLSGLVQAYGNLPDAAHPSGGDDPTTHDAFDLNVNVLPDPGYEQLLGGLESSGSGNFAGDGEETARVHLERESTSLPRWSWPDAGDRVQVMGSWVWDCGHWDPGGERTEIHPYRAIWDERAPSARSPFGESEGDLYVTTDATPAGQIAECAHRTKGDQVAYKACSFAQPNWLDVSGDYTLTLAAPPRPPGATSLAVRVVDRGSTVDPHWRSTIAGGKLTLAFHLDSPQNERVVLAKQVFLGWRSLPAASRRRAATRSPSLRASGWSTPTSQASGRSGRASCRRLTARSFHSASRPTSTFGPRNRGGCSSSRTSATSASRPGATRRNRWRRARRPRSSATSRATTCRARSSSATAARRPSARTPRTAPSPRPRRARRRTGRAATACGGR